MDKSPMNHLRLVLNGVERETEAAERSAAKE
jgi:hypothetical protein